MARGIVSFIVLSVLAACNSPFLHGVDDIPEPNDTPVGGCRDDFFAYGLQANPSTASGTHIQWQSLADGSYQMRVERETLTASGFVEMTTLPGTARSYDDNSCNQADSWCRYRVTAFNSSCTTTTSAAVQAFTLSAAPTGVTIVTTGAAGDTIQLTFTDVNRFESNYVIERADNPAGPFATISTLSAQSGTGAPLSLDDAGLALNGAYTYRIAATVSGVIGNYATATGYTTPAAPSGLIAANGSVGQIRLDWTDNALVETAYVVERALLSDMIFSVRSASIAADSETFTDIDLANILPDTTYVYRLRARTTYGPTTLDSTTVEVQVTTPLRGPNNLDIVLTGPGAADLSWDDQSAVETAYRVDRSSDGVNFTTLTDTLPANSNAYSDNGLSAESHYTYRVYAVLGASLSQEDVNDVWTELNPPSAATVIGNSGTAASVAWTDNSAVETGYRIVQTEQPAGSPSNIDLAADIEVYNATGLTNNASYTFVIEARLSYNDLHAVPKVQTSSTLSTVLPSPTTNATVSTLAADQLRIGYTNVVGESGYRVERYDATGTSLLGTNNEIANTVQSDFGSLISDTSYRFQIRVLNSNGGTSAPLTIDGATPPTTPTGLTVVAPNGPAVALDLTWSDQSSSETEFRILRCSGTGCTPTVQIATVAANSSSYTDNAGGSGLNPNTLYRYSVVAANANGTNNPTSATSVVGAYTRTAPSLSWGAAPTVSNACLLDIPGTVTYDPQHGGTVFSSATGTIDGAAATANGNGISITLSNKTPRTIATQWSVTDSANFSDTLNRDLTVQYASVVTTTPVPLPAAPLLSSEDILEGRQVFGADPTGCVNCSGARGSLTANSGVTCVVTATGTVDCWGANGAGQAGGDIPSGNVVAPAAVCDFGQAPPCSPPNTLDNVVEVSAGGQFSCALLAPVAGGNVACWGDQSEGQLGNGVSTGSTPTPHYVCTTAPCDATPANRLSGVVGIATGIGHACALTSSGAVYCWGRNTDGQMGDGTIVPKDIATPVCQTGSGAGCSGGAAFVGAVGIAAGNSHTCALMLNGEVQCWGQAASGQIGDGTTGVSGRQENPQLVCASGSAGTCVALGSVISLALGGLHSCALLNDNTIKCWGSDAAQQLGEGPTSTADQLNPVTVCATGEAGSCVAQGGVDALAAGTDYSCAHLNNSELRCWGNNTNGKLGDGAVATRANPVPVCATGVGNGTSCVGGASITDTLAIVAGDSSTCVAMATPTGQLRCWGNNLFYQLGDGTTFQRENPALVCLTGSGPGCSGGAAYASAALYSCGVVEVVP